MSDDDEVEILDEKTSIEVMLDLVQQLNALQVKAESLGNDCKDVKKFIGETSYKVTSRYRKKKEESKQKKRLNDQFLPPPK